MGVLAGYLGGRVDAVLMRFVDALLSPADDPRRADASRSRSGPSFRNLVLVLGLLIWPNVARLIRAETLQLKGQDLRALRPRHRRSVLGILMRHIIPNIMPTLLVATTLEVGHVILAEATLSFLGAGVPPPSASWGVMVSDGRALIATGWWIAIFPGARDPGHGHGLQLRSATGSATELDPEGSAGLTVGHAEPDPRMSAT